MKRRLTALVSAALIVFSAAACTTGSSSDDGTTASKGKNNVVVAEKGYTEKTITTTKKGEINEVTVPYERQKLVEKQVTEEVTKEDPNKDSSKEQNTAGTGYSPDEVVSLSINNSKAVSKNWLGLNSVYQGFIFIPDATKLGRSYNQKMLERELKRIDEMDISLIRSYFEPSYAYVGGNVNDASSWDFSKKNPNMMYLYQWLDALKERNIVVALNMGWSAGDLYNEHTSISVNNPFYGCRFSDVVSGYAYWYAESLKWIIDKYGYTNVQYTVNLTEPLYYEYSAQKRQELNYRADISVENKVYAKNPAMKGVPMYMAKIGEKDYVCNAKTCYSKEMDEDYNYIHSFPDFYDITTGAKVNLTKKQKLTARLYTTWDMWLVIIKAADKKAKANGIRKKVQFVGPDVAFGGTIHMSYEKGVLTGKTPEMKPEDDIQWWIDHADDVIDVYSFHYYLPHWPGIGATQSATFYDDNYYMYKMYFDRFMEAVKPTGKAMWFDEFNYNTDTGENRQHYDDIVAENPLNPGQLAQATVAMMNSGIETGLTWQLFDTVWPYREGSGDEFVSGIHVIGMAPAMCKSSVPYISYYGFTLLTKYCGMMGSKTFYGESSDGVNLSMVEYQKKGKTYRSIIVVNTNVTERPVDITLSKSLGGVKMYRYLYNPFEVMADSSATMIDADICFKGTKNELRDVVPALSFAIYSTEYHVDN